MCDVGTRRMPDNAGGHPIKIKFCTQLEELQPEEISSPGEHDESDFEAKSVNFQFQLRGLEHRTIT